MKITDPGVIKNGEKDLIEMLREDLDLDMVREIIKQKMTAAALSPKGGEIVVHNNQVAFRMDFDLYLSGSLMFDRQGNHIPESDEPFDPEEDSDETNESSPGAVEEDIQTEEKFEIGLPDDDLEPPEELDNLDNPDELNNLDNPDELYELDNLDELTEDPEPDLREEDAPLMMDDLADDDMADILKESRDFWEKKKDS